MLRLLCLLLTASLLGGCYYDHRWTQERQAKKRREEQAKANAQLEVAGPSAPARYVGRIRVHATAAYRGQHLDWRREMREIVKWSSESLRRSLGLRLEVVDVREWEADCDETDLGQCLSELATLDPGEDVEWVVGLVSNLSHTTERFDDLGMAALPGKHVLLRGIASAQAQDAVDREFADLSLEDRNEIYQARKRHKAQVLFLHELGHTLGALHVRDERALLNPTYAHDAADFTEATRGALRAGLEDRFDEESSGFGQLLAYYQVTTSDSWWPAQRSELLAQLEAQSGQGQAVAAASGAPGGVRRAEAMAEQVAADESLRGLDEASQAAYYEAAAAFDAGDLPAAHAALDPLVEAHLDSFPVQQLACELALRIGQRQRAEATCPRAHALGAR